MGFDGYLKRVLWLPLILVFFWLGIAGLQASQVPDEFDFSRLAHPEVADSLQLTDVQRTEISRLVGEQATRLAAVAEPDRPAVRQEFAQKIRAQLNADQLAKLAELPELRKLQFNFGSQNWEDVLRWFAKQADLSLVMSSAPEGAFNYTDSNEYTPAQAINLLNSILLTKGYTLVRRDKLLILVEISNGIPDELLPRVTLDELDRRGSFDIVSVMFSLGAKPSNAVMAEVKPILGSYGKIALLPQSNQLLVTETVGKIKAISMLIESVPTPSPPPEKVVEKAVPPVLETYPLGGLDFTSTAETIKSIASGAVVSGGTASQKIVVFAPPSQQALIKSLLEQLNSGTPLQEQFAKLQIHRIDQPIDSKQLLEQLALVVPQAKIAFDAANRRLMVFATEAQQLEVAEALKKLEIVTISDASHQVRLFSLRHADPTVASQMALAISPRAGISVDVATKSLVVRADPGELEIISQLVDQLDRPATPADSLTLKSYDLPRGSHTEFLATLQSLAPKSKLQLDSQASKLLVIASETDQQALADLISQFQTARPFVGDAGLKTFEVTATQKTQFLALQKSLPQEFGQFQVIADDQPTRLTVWADEEKQKMLEEILTQLKSQDSADSTMVLKSYVSTVEDLAGLQAMIKPQFPELRITANATNDRLLVWATPTEQDRFAAQFDNLNREMPQREQTSVKFYSADPAQMNLATALFAQVAPGAKVQWDATTRQFSVIATERDQAKIALALADLQVGARRPATPELVVYPLAAELRPRFDAVFATLSAQFSDVKIVDDKRTGEVAVLASAEQHLLIKEMVAQINRPIEGGELYSLQAYACGNSEPKQVVDLLTQLFPSAKILGDDVAIRVLVWAQATVHQEIAKVLQEFLPDPTTAGANPWGLRSYKLQNVRAASALALVQQLVPKMQLVANDEQGILLGWGRERDHEKLKIAIEQINLPEDPKRLSIQVYSTGELDPQIASAVLSRVMPDAAVVPNANAKLLAVLARGEQQLLVQQALKQMSTFVTTGGPLQVNSFRVERAGATAVVAALTPIFSQAKLFPGVNATQVIALANADDLEKIRQAIEKIESDSLVSNGIKLRVYQVRPDLAAQVRPLIQAALPNLKLVSSDPTTLAVLGREEEQAQVQSLLSEAEKQLVAEPKKVKAYRLEDIAPPIARQALTQRLPQLAYVELGDAQNLYVLGTEAEHQTVEQIWGELQAAIVQPPEQVFVTYRLPDVDLAQLMTMLPQDLTSKATLKADPENELLLVAAADSVQAELKPIIEQLQATLPKADKIVSRIYPLSGLAAKDWTTLLSSLAPGAVVASDPNSGSLVVAAKVSTHQKIQNLIDEFRQALTVGKVARPYRISKAEVQVVADAIAALLPGAKVSVDKPSRSLMIVANEEDQSLAAKTIQEIDAHAPAAAISEVHAVQTGDAAALATALKVLLPGAAFVPDSTGKSMLVLATTDEQIQVRKTVEQWTSDPSRRLLTKVYPLSKADPQATLPVLQKLLPGATFSADTATRTLAATATEQQHIAIAETIRELDSATESVETKIYPAGSLLAKDWQALLAQLAPGAVSAVDPVTGSLVVTARPPVHAQLEKVVKEFRESAIAGKSIRAYRLSQADPQVAADAITALLPNVKVSTDKLNRTVVVVVTDKDIELVDKTVEQIDRQSQNAAISQIYPIASGDATALATALKSLVPSGTYVGDASGKTLLVIASPSDQELIKRTVNDWSSDQRRAVTSHVFPLRNADPQTTLAALQKLVPGATLAAEPNTRSLLVTGTAEQQDLIRAAVEQLDGIGAISGEMSLKTYPVARAPSEALAKALKDLFKADQLVSVVSDKDLNSIIAVARPKQHEMIASLIAASEESFGADGHKSELQAYGLANTDGKVLVDSLTKLFERERPPPQLSFDATGQQLLVVGTPVQHSIVRQFVQNMRGEQQDFQVYRLQKIDPLTAESAINGLFRQEPKATAPQVQIDYDSAFLFVRASTPQLERIRKLLVELGEPDPTQTAAGTANLMRVIPLTVETKTVVEQLQRIWPELKKNELKVIEPAVPESDPNPDDKSQPSSGRSTRSGLPLSFAVHRIGTPQDVPLKAETPPAAQDQDPIFLIPGNRELTILTADEAAAKQLEQLIRAIAGLPDEGKNSGNFETFSLKNAGASDVASLLTDLFTEMAETRSETRLPVVITADDRLNLVIVHGSRNDREVIGGLIRILDSPDLNEAFAVNQPVIVPVKNTDAERLLKILSSVYRSQLSSGGGRRQIPIPDGVSSELASMLQQINAATSGPILTLGVDVITNSIIILAPPQLRDQVRATVEQLDRNVETEPGEEIEIIQLQKTNPVRIQRALDLLFKENKK